MGSLTGRIRRGQPATGLALALLVLRGMSVAYGADPLSDPTAPRTSAPATLLATSQAAAPGSAYRPLKLLKVEPVKGYAGDPFTVTGDGLTPGKRVEFFWVTADATYLTKTMVDNVEYHERKYQEKRVQLGSAPVNAQGRVTAVFVAPEDYGEVHDLYAVVDGQDVARGGFRILRSAAITPTEGPVGTPITITVKGLGWRGFEQFMAARYDNKYTGEISAVTTKGTAIFQIRAAGPPGKHIIQLNNSTAYVAGAYLNTQQSPQDYIYAHLDNKQEFRFVFNVAKDAGPPPDTLQWPDSNRVAQLNRNAPRTTMSLESASQGSATLHPAAGPILSQTTLRAASLPPNTDVGLFFVTARGNRMGPSGWNLDSIPLARGTTAADGSLTATVQIPDDLGGWHMVKLAESNRVLMEIPYYIEQSLVAVTPKRVKVGETFTVQIKGSGWTELDNTVAVTYDNAAMGYACGFNSNGDITINLVATGHPGTHLIDLYPAIYKGRDRVPWNYQTPFLTFARDFPALAVGYRLPAYRLAIAVIE
ncbi:MAG: hypothetical protein HYY46_11275 [Deltaproteobacteria bacterium]|nr:hypothetical protein [Deltaproteobacteria bacterium]